MFRRRREINLWSNGLLREHVVACYASHPDRDDVRAVVVFHLDLDLLPKDATARAQAAAAQRGDAFEGIPLFTAFCFALEGPDQLDLLMGDLALAMRERCGFDSAEEAAPYAFQWVGEDGLVLPFDNIPGSTKQPSLNSSRAGRLSSRRRLCCGSFLLRGITPWSASAQEPSRTRKRPYKPQIEPGAPGWLSTRTGASDHRVSSDRVTAPAGPEPADGSRTRAAPLACRGSDR